MFHFASDAASGGVPLGAPLGQGVAGPRPPPGPLPAPGAAAPPAAPAAAPPAGGAAVGGAAAGAGAGAGARGGRIQLRYCTPPLMLPVPFIRSFSSKLATLPPCQTRYTVPVGFSHEGSITIAPSSTFQLSSPDQPFSVLPSQRETQPSCSWKSIGSGCRKPPPPPPPARPLPAPCGAPFGPAGEVPGACAGGAP